MKFLGPLPSESNIRAFEEAGLVTVREHDDLPLRIVNYTPQAQFQRVWTPWLRMCRGLVFDQNWNLVARPLPKFFNYEEHLGPEPPAGPLPTGPYTVEEKYDGSLGIIFRYRGRLLVATRGSFNSEQALRAAELLEQLPATQRIYLAEGHTHLVEIIYPENRIVVNYGGEARLQYLTSIDTATGEELPGMAADIFGGAPRSYPAGIPVEELKRQQRLNAEGYVLRFANGERVKVKFDEYVRLHALVTGLDTVRLWELLREGKDPMAQLESIPDELYGWAEKEVKDLVQKHETWMTSAIAKMTELRDRMNGHGRHEFAELAKQEQHPHLLFMAVDGNMDRLRDAVWKLIKPERRKPLIGETC